MKSATLCGRKTGNNPNGVTGSAARINFSFTLHLSLGRQIKAGGRGQVPINQKLSVLFPIHGKYVLGFRLTPIKRLRIALVHL